uniref:NADH dehydrogenase subunit 6 n=1 Tax=Lyonsia norwegica TaxID=228471 RepID=A0A1U9XPI0_LYONO|nr:NADH dehydrogenase subunit 6 [Lyonsia norwegica]AQZ26156.1 NADH dehydrogenase subunit 6 [Lyonsia norwegica]
MVVLGVLGFVFPYLISAQHPLSLSALILITAVALSVSVGLEVSNYFGYILFLIYAGALLVVFTFSSALTSNPHFKPVSAIWGGGFSIVVIFVGQLLVEAQYKWHSVLTPTPHGASYDGLLVVGHEEGLWGVVYMGLIMFVVMVACAKLCNRQHGAIRS